MTRKVCLFLLAALPLAAEFRWIEQQFGGIECASCAGSLERSLGRLRGVRAASVDPARSVVRLDLEEGNRIKLDDLRDRIKGAGFTPGGAEVRVAGVLRRSGDQWRLDAGIPVVYDLEWKGVQAPAADADGKSVVIAGDVPASAGAAPQALLQVRALTVTLPLAERIGRTDPAKYNVRKGVHAGAGELHYMTVLARDTLDNLNFLHRGVVMPKSSIGHHFHNISEEIFFIFGGEGEFTIDGRTSRLVGPVGVPLRGGHSHALYNPTDKPLEWMNISVRLPGVDPNPVVRDPAATFDLGDDRANVTLDPKPVFMTMPLDHALLQSVERMNGGKGTVRYRRLLGPSVYTSNWAYIDHVVVPPGASIGRHKHEGVEEFYYVIDGRGSVTVNRESSAIGKGDAVPVRFGEVHSFENTGPEDLEMLTIGIAKVKGELDTVDVVE
ncbi:MAG: cupin domain-containing protein [Bryobacteraceae bacterium]